MVLPHDDTFVIRQADHPDADALIAFNGRIHGDLGGATSSAFRAWTSDLTSGRHPRVEIGDFLIAVERATGAIASTLCVIPQTWRYENAEFAVGRVELVGSDESFRGRGLVRRLMVAADELARANGIDVLAVTGLPWFYRQFGYEYALPFGFAAPDNDWHAEQWTESLAARPALSQDADAICSLLAASTRPRSEVTAERTPADVRWELDGQSPESVVRLVVGVVEDSSGALAGVFAHQARVIAGELWVAVLEAAPGQSFPDVLDVVLRELRRRGEALGTNDVVLRLWGGPDHPAYDYLPRERLGDAWYLRVVDPAAFLRRLAPELQRRLSASAVFLEGKLELDFFKSGVALEFAGDDLRVASQRVTRDGRWASIPEGSFVQLLFGYRSFAELEDANPDCRASDPATAELLDVLFPKRSSLVWPLA